MVDPPVAATAAMAFSNAAGVRICRGRRFRAQQVDDERARLARDVVFAGVHRRHRGAAKRREPQELARRRHRVRGELPSAGARPRTRRVLERRELLGAELPAIERAHGLEDVLDGDVLPLPAARRDRPAIEDEAGNIEPGERHGRARDRLVAADENHQRVELVGPRHELDRVRDDLAADERHPHPLGAHGDAVGHRDGVELHRRRPGGAHAFLDRGRETAEVQVAGTDLDPGVGDPDEGLPQVVVGEPDRLEHGPGGGAVAAAEVTAARERARAAGLWVGRSGPGHTFYRRARRAKSVKIIILHFT